MSFLAMPNLLTLGGMNLTDEGREPLSIDIDERSTVVDLASGRKKKFIQRVCFSYDISWENVSYDKTTTIDGHAGFKEIFALVHSADPLYLHVEADGHTANNIEVFVSGFSSEITRRRACVEGNLYTINLSLEEV